MLRDIIFLKIYPKAILCLRLVRWATTGTRNKPSTYFLKNLPESNFVLEVSAVGYNRYTKQTINIASAFLQNEWKTAGGEY